MPDNTCAATNYENEIHDARPPTSTHGLVLRSANQPGVEWLYGRSASGSGRADRGVPGVGSARTGNGSNVIRELSGGQRAEHA